MYNVCKKKKFGLMNVKINCMFQRLFYKNSRSLHYAISNKFEIFLVTKQTPHTSFLYERMPFKCKNPKDCPIDPCNYLASFVL